MRRLLRAGPALLLLAGLLAGVPLVLTLTVGNPLPGWDGLRAGDLSGEVLLDVLAVVGWIAWAAFAWAVAGEILALAAGRPRPHLPAVMPGPQYLAHSLVTAVVLVLPSTGTLPHPGPPAHLSSTTHLPSPAIALHSVPTAADISDATRAGPPQAPAPGPPGQPRAPMHRAAGDPDDASLSALMTSGFSQGAGAGLVAGISLRELARLRRRQWRHRRPGRAVPATPTALIGIEKALTQRGDHQISDTDRAHLLAAHASTEDQAMGPARGLAPWDAFCDAAGAPLPEYTLHEPDPAPLTGQASTPSPATIGLSVLTQPVPRVLTASATTARDMAVLAPQVHERIRRLVAQADPTLDDDLAAWHDPRTHRPRLAVLGPIRVRAAGELASTHPRLAWHTEVLTYLTAHPRGVTPDQLGTSLWPDDPDIQGKPKVRQAAHNVRRWLGTNPRTGQPYLPPTPPNADVTLYRVEDLLSDADLFRRLRLRGITHGPQGLHDLETALALVTGPPFDPTHRRRDGYTWLLDTPQDTECTAMIIDVAHIVATHHLSTGRHDLAALAARTSLTAGSRDDIPLLDLVAACDAQGHHSEATHWIRQILTTHGTDIEEDLPPRTAEILHRRQWRHLG